VWCHSAKNSQVNHRNSENQTDQRITCVVYSAKTSESTAQIKEGYLQISELTSHIMFKDGHQKIKRTDLSIHSSNVPEPRIQTFSLHPQTRAIKLSSPDPENA
jgi:hypothetical protein